MDEVGLHLIQHFAEAFLPGRAAAWPIGVPRRFPNTDDGWIRSFRMPDDCLQRQLSRERMVQGSP